VLLEDWLTELGHQPVGPVASVEDALRVIGAASFDAAILDVNPRGQRCDPVADVLLARGVPFAFTTGDAADTVDKRFAGRPTVTKPYDFETVESIIVSMVDFDHDPAPRSSDLPDA
jgi:hypothetical protein